MFKRIKISILHNRKVKLNFFATGFIVCLILIFAAGKAIKYTSTDNYCMSCHIHPHAEQTWRLSTHYNNKSGTIVHCVECHLAPEGKGYLFTKAKHGLKDLYGYWFKDSASINWEAKRLVENAKNFVYEKSCLECHQNLFPVTLSKEGDDAHLFYTLSENPPRCINCHLTVGHFDKNFRHAKDTTFGVIKAADAHIYKEPAKVEKFEDFTETIPGTNVSFRMKAIPGGKYMMGSPDDEPLRDNDEGPVREVTVSPFWIGEVEVTWDEYLAFFQAASSQGRTEGQVVTTGKVDAIWGPTPPWVLLTRGGGRAHGLQ